MVKGSNHERAFRAGLLVFILLSSLAMLPFVDLPEAIGWEMLAGVYQPELTVDTLNGVSGSVFAFTGTNYPPNSLATIYIDGVEQGTLLTDDLGQATFSLDTRSFPDGALNVTLEVDINASATRSITLLPAPTPTSTPSPTITPEPTLTPPPATEEAVAIVTTAPPATTEATVDQALGNAGQDGLSVESTPSSISLLLLGGGVVLALALFAILIWRFVSRA